MHLEIRYPEPEHVPGDRRRFIFIRGEPSHDDPPLDCGGARLQGGHFNSGRRGAFAGGPGCGGGGIQRGRDEVRRRENVLPIPPRRGQVGDRGRLERGSSRARFLDSDRELPDEMEQLASRGSTEAVNGLVRIASTPEEFVEAIAAALIEDADERRTRADDLLQTMSWDKTYEAMSELIDDVVMKVEREASANGETLSAEFSAASAPNASERV